MCGSAVKSTNSPIRRIVARRANRYYLAALAAALLPIALAAVMAHRSQARIREIERVGGQVFTFPAGPRWLRRLIGDRWGFEQAGQVYLRNAQVTDPVIAHLKEMKS